MRSVAAWAAVSASASCVGAQRGGFGGEAGPDLGAFGAGQGDGGGQLGQLADAELAAELAEGVPGRSAGQPGGLQRAAELGERPARPGRGGVGQGRFDAGAAGQRDHHQVQERGQGVAGVARGGRRPRAGLPGRARRTRPRPGRSPPAAGSCQGTMSAARGEQPGQRRGRAAARRGRRWPARRAAVRAGRPRTARSRRRAGVGQAQPGQQAGGGAAQPGGPAARRPAVTSGGRGSRVTAASAWARLTRAGRQPGGDGEQAQRRTPAPASSAPVTAAPPFCPAGWAAEAGQDPRGSRRSRRSYAATRTRRRSSRRPAAAPAARPRCRRGRGSRGSRRAARRSAPRWRR